MSTSVAHGNADRCRLARDSRRTIESMFISTTTKRVECDCLSKHRRIFIPISCTKQHDRADPVSDRHVRVSLLDGVATPSVFLRVHVVADAARRNDLPPMTTTNRDVATVQTLFVHRLTSDRYGRLI
jgi:hypothetical protein